jgi:hypothetical protein
MAIIFSVLAAIGLWFFLGMFHGLHTSMIGTVFDYTISWFQVLFTVGLLTIVKVGLGGK